jgi:hypothetical protein
MEGNWNGFKIGEKVPIQRASNEKNVDTWKRIADAVSNADKSSMETIDENELLRKSGSGESQDNTVIRGAVSTSCESKTTKKACRNCTCGLAQEQAAEATSVVPRSSSCGSCYLGDAFRCGTCPYRGMPAFKPGEEVSIASMKDDLDDQDL